MYVWIGFFGRKGLVLFFLLKVFKLLLFFLVVCKGNDVIFKIKVDLGYGIGIIILDYFCECLVKYFNFWNRFIVEGGRVGLGVYFMLKDDLIGEVGWVKEG